jgi:hypothetical protein
MMNAEDLLDQLRINVYGLHGYFHQYKKVYAHFENEWQQEDPWIHPSELREWHHACLTFASSIVLHKRSIFMLRDELDTQLDLDWDFLQGCCELLSDSFLMLTVVGIPEEWYEYPLDPLELFGLTIESESWVDIETAISIS